VWLGGIACARQCVRAFVYVFDLTEYYFKDTRSGNIWWPDSAGACIFIFFGFSWLPPRKLAIPLVLHVYCTVDVERTCHGQWPLVTWPALNSPNAYWKSYRFVLEPLITDYRSDWNSKRWEWMEQHAAGVMSTAARPEDILGARVGHRNRGWFQKRGIGVQQLIGAWEFTCRS